jgi:hypothetical protein
MFKIKVIHKGVNFSSNFISESLRRDRIISSLYPYQNIKCCPWKTFSRNLSKIEINLNEYQLETVESSFSMIRTKERILTQPASFHLDVTRHEYFRCYLEFSSPWRFKSRCEVCDIMECCGRIPTIQTVVLPPSSGWSEWRQVQFTLQPTVSQSVSPSVRPSVRPSVLRWASFVNYDCI